MNTFSINIKSEIADYDFLSKHVDRLCKNRTIEDSRLNEWFSEIFINRLERKRHKDIADYENLDSYVYKCDLNTKVNDNKKEVNIVSTEEFEKYKAGYLGDLIKADDFIDDTIFELDKVTLEKDLIEMHEFILIQEGVDILYLIEKLVNKDWNYKLVNKVVTIAKKHSLEELIADLLRDKNTFIQLYKKVYEDQLYK